MKRTFYKESRDVMLLKHKREELGLTQAQTAKIIGISERHYRNIELGRTFGTQKVVNSLEDYFELPQRVLLAKSVEEVPEYLKQYTHKV